MITSLHVMSRACLCHYTQAITTYYFVIITQGSIKILLIITYFSLLNSQKVETSCFCNSTATETLRPRCGMQTLLSCSAWATYSVLTDTKGKIWIYSNESKQEQIAAAIWMSTRWLQCVSGKLEYGSPNSGSAYSKSKPFRKILDRSYILIYHHNT